MSKLQRLYGGGDFTKFPDIKFTGELNVLVVSVNVCGCWIFIRCVTFASSVTDEHLRSEQGVVSYRVSADRFRHENVILILCQARKMKGANFKVILYCHSV